MLEDITKTIYLKDDEPLLTKLYENDTDGKPRCVGYKFYLGTVCMILVNGGKGIASGYSTDIPNYNPVDISHAHRLWLDAYDAGTLDSLELPVMVPWYRGFKGTIELLETTGLKTPKYQLWTPDSGNQPIAWRSKGILEPIGTANQKGGIKKYQISEAPIGLWTNRLKEWIEYLWSGTPPEKSKKKKAERTFLTEQRWRGTINSVLFEITPTKDFTPDIDVAGNFKILQTTRTLTNMHVIDENNYPRRYKSPQDLIKDFSKMRIVYYKKRKIYNLKTWNQDLIRETGRRKFLIAVRDGTLNINQDEDILEVEMIKKKFVKVDDSFDYLLDMKIRTMTPKRLAQVEKDIQAIKDKITDLENTTESDLWRADLDKFDAAWIKFQKTRKEE